MWETPVLSMFLVNVKLGNKCFLLILLSERLLSSGRAGISDVYDMRSHTIWKQAYLSRFRHRGKNTGLQIGSRALLIVPTCPRECIAFPSGWLRHPDHVNLPVLSSTLITCLGHVTWPFRKYQLACEYKEKTSSPAPLQHWLLTALDPRRKYWEAH